MTVAEAAKILEVKPTVVYELCARRLLGHRRVGIGRGVIRIDRADLDAYLESCRVEPRQPRPAERTNGTGLAVRSVLGELRAEEERRRELKLRKEAAPRARPRAGG